MTLRPLINTILILLLLAVIVGPALSQTDTEASLREAHIRNGELLKEAESLVRETNSIKARVAFEAARKLYEQSEELLMSFRFVMAGRTIKQTRQAILQAINIARSEAKLEEDALRAMERAVSRLDAARSALEEHGDRDDVPARRLVVDAREQLQRARNHIHEHMFGVALQLANASADLSQRALMMLRQETLTPDDVIRAIEQTDRVLERLESGDADIGGPRGDRMVAEAFDIQNSAKASARAGRYQVAFERTRRARQMALRMLKMSAGKDNRHDKDDVARAIAFTDELIDRAAALSAETGSPSSDDLAAVTREQQQAKDQFAKDNLTAALRLTSKVRDDVRKLLRGVDRPIDQGRVHDALERTDNVLKRAREAVADGNESARAIYERATVRQNEAWRAFERGELRKALALTRVARKLAREAIGQIDDAG